MSELEQIVYHIEREMVLNLKKTFPAIGFDIKVLGLRKNNRIVLTIACAFIGKYIKNIDEYFNIKNELENRIFTCAKTFTNRDVEVFINTGDDKKTNSCYLTVSGTSAENGDTGSVGRGNRCNGIISPGRPMSMEACSGKNCVSHTGKLYNLLSNEIAKDIAINVEGVEEVYIKLLSQIGKPIDKPLIASVQILIKDGYNFNKIQIDCENIVDTRLENINNITQMLIRGELSTF